MLIEDNPFTKKLHSIWRQRIGTEFANVKFANDTDYLSLIKYLDGMPQKFYSKEAFNLYLTALYDIKNNRPDLLADILKEVESVLSISNRILTEVNEKNTHDIFLPSEPNELINFIDKEIHYNLLKIYETPFFHFCYILAKYHWIKNGKGTDGLVLHNAVPELIKAGFAFIDPLYLHDVRNGIAHGKIIFSDSEILYIDKKGNKTTVPIRKIINTFDGILDVTNGFCLAFKVFCFTNTIFFEKNKIAIPQSILLEELQAKANGPAWTITNCLETVSIGDKRQLNIYIYNDNWDYSKVNFYCFTSAYWAEAITKSYDRIFFSLYSKNAKISPSGWAAYDGTKFRELRQRNEMDFTAYRGVCEGDLIFFVPKIKFPKFIYKFGTYYSSIRINFPLAWPAKFKQFFVRETKMHSKGSYAVVQDPSVIINSQFKGDYEELIRKNRKKIVKLAIRYSRKKYGLFSLTRYLPVRYIRVFIYDTDMRVRNLRNSGLIPQLVATIEVNTSKQIKTIDIIGGTVEEYEKYRIVWNKNWQGKKAVT